MTFIILIKVAVYLGIGRILSEAVKLVIKPNDFDNFGLGMTMFFMILFWPIIAPTLLGIYIGKSFFSRRQDDKK